MKTLSLLTAAALLIATAAAQEAAPKASPSEALNAARAAENKSVALASLKQEALQSAALLYLKPKTPTAEGLLCARRSVVQVKTNKRRTTGEYITTPEPSKASAPDVLLVNEKPRPAGEAFVLVTVYPCPKPQGLKRDMECYALTPEAAALAHYEARQAAKAATK